jgi:ABC-type antimicrobial peptide transport system permease subunit
MRARAACLFWRKGTTLTIQSGAGSPSRYRAWDCSMQVMKSFWFSSARILEPFLFRVGILDPGTLGAVAVILSTCALAASLVPARRATRVNPAVALRSD